MTRSVYLDDFEIQPLPKTISMPPFPAAVMMKKQNENNNNDISNAQEKSTSPDIDLGAYLVCHMRQLCENCGTYNTPQWRKGWYSELLGRSVLLCNACGLKYHKNQFCPYCKYVYGKEHDKVEDGWLTCQTCGRWVHIDCERKHNRNFSENHIYHCPGCRGSSDHRGSAMQTD